MPPPLGLQHRPRSHINILRQGEFKCRAKGGHAVTIHRQLRLVALLRGGNWRRLDESPPDTGGVRRNRVCVGFAAVLHCSTTTPGPARDWRWRGATHIRQNAECAAACTATPALVAIWLAAARWWGVEKRRSASVCQRFQETVTLRQCYAGVRL